MLKLFFGRHVVTGPSSEHVKAPVSLQAKTGIILKRGTAKNQSGQFMIFSFRTTIVAIINADCELWL